MAFRFMIVKSIGPENELSGVRNLRRSRFVEKCLPFFFLTNTVFDTLRNIGEFILPRRDPCIKKHAKNAIPSKTNNE